MSCEKKQKSNYYQSIKYFPNYIISKSGKVKNLKKNKCLKPQDNGNGYLFVRLFSKKVKKGKIFYVHRLMLLTFRFIQNYKDMEVNHKDCNTYNNKLSNLEWLTKQENLEHAKNFYRLHPEKDKRRMKKNKNAIKKEKN